MNATLQFTYTVTHEGLITFKLVYGEHIGVWAAPPAFVGTPPFAENTNGAWDGVLSQDGNTIQITWGSPMIWDILDQPGPNGKPQGPQVIGNASFTLFKVPDGFVKKFPGGPAPGR